MKRLMMAAAALGLLATGATAQPYYPPGYRPPPPPGYYPPPPPGYYPPPPAYRPPPVVVVPGGPPPGAWRHRRPYGYCQAKAAQLRDFEYRMVHEDGRVSKDEARIARSLRAQLARDCGGGRWEPNRGWYYR